MEIVWKQFSWIQISLLLVNKLSVFDIDLKRGVEFVIAHNDAYLVGLAQEVKLSSLDWAVFEVVLNGNLVHFPLYIIVPYEVRIS